MSLIRVLTSHNDSEFVPMIHSEENLLWTKLENYQCKHYPLTKEDNAYCPVAYNLNPIMTLFGKDESIITLTCEVEISQRKIIKKTDIQTALASLVGLIMATSACPSLDGFRPMAASHHPFSSDSETPMRSIAMYLMGQFLRSQRGLSTDFSLKKYNDLFKEISEMNHDFATRIKSRKEKDAGVNALIILDIFAQMNQTLNPEHWLKAIDEFYCSPFWHT